MTPDDFLAFLNSFDKTIAPGLGRDAQAARNLLTIAFANKLGEDNMFALLSCKEHYAVAVKMASWVKSPSQDFLTQLASLGWSNINLYLKDSPEFIKYDDVARLVRLREVIDDRYMDLIDYAPFTATELVAVYHWRISELEHVLTEVSQEQLIVIAKIDTTPELLFNLDFVVKHRSVFTSDTLSLLDARLPTLLGLLEDDGSKHETKVEQLASLLRMTNQESIPLPHTMELDASL